MKILIVDDEEELRQRLRQALIHEHYMVDTAENGEEALDKIVDDDSFDLIILDIMMPGRDGLSVLKELRKEGINTPVLMLTALGDLDNRVRGLDQGADDYLAKPFSMSELLARLRAMLRRGRGKNPLLTCGAVSLNTVNRSVTLDDMPITLTVKEFAMLEFLLYNKGRVVSRFSLAEHVWGDNFDPFTMSNFIDVHMKNLRQKIKKDDRDSIIRTIRGTGYIIDDGP
ncbi:MAG: response regulator transcription factor [Proteobacteria bacterium]|nr:response regulator transcription factor [Pseudomonadota bacterium]MBU0965245.1 response regulator transcription factor [Pseudomonadota bacterium]